MKKLLLLVIVGGIFFLVSTPTFGAGTETEKSFFSKGTFEAGLYHLGIQGTIKNNSIFSEVDVGVALGIQEGWWAVSVGRSWNLGFYPEDFFSLGGGYVWNRDPKIKGFNIQGEYHHPLTTNFDFFVGDSISLLSVKDEEIKCKGWTHEPFIGVRVLMKNGQTLDIFYNPEFAFLEGEGESAQDAETGIGALNFTLRIPLFTKKEVK